MATLPVADMIRRIQGEYLEMPGLRLTSQQAQRLWGLDQSVCDALLSVLVDLKFLACTRDGAFVRSGSPLRRSDDAHAVPATMQGRRVDTAA